jgi:hypothetical protein
MAVRKFGKVGMENPLSKLVISVINWEADPKKNKSNRLVKTKKYTLSQLNDFVNRATAAWSAACEWVKRGGKIELEVSTVEQEFSRWDKVLPYIQIKCGKSFYRINLPEEAEGMEKFKEDFGEFYAEKDIRPIVNKWLDGEDCDIVPAMVVSGTETPNDVDEGEEVMQIQQETDLFVVSKGKVWSVDTGKCLQKIERLSDEKPSYIFAYKRCDYNNSYFKFVIDIAKMEVLVIECQKDEYDLPNVECVQYCLIEEIRTGWLVRLEKMYRDGRSNLPDAVFDHIMEVRGMTEEHLQAICGGESKSQWHYNSYGVQSSKCVPSVKSSDHYPADDKILSQDKVRDPQKLADIVRSWNGKAVVSWKLDGAAVRLHYKGKSFVRAESKGKARDVTALMRNIKDVPEVINHGFPFVENWFGDKEWFVTGELVTKNGRRSVAAGYLLRKDTESEQTKDIASRLSFIVYDSNICEYQTKNPMVSPLRLYSQMINLLGTEAGFRVVDLCEFKGAEQISSENIMEDLQIPQEFDTDGLVIRLNDIKKYVSMGETSHHPKGSVAFKFEDEWKQVKPDCIYGKRGSNGVIKIIAEFRPLHFGDKTVKSAVWQPKDDGRYHLEYNSSLWNKGGGEAYEVWYTDYTNGGKKKFSEHFNVEKIEVCLRGKVIPQWRLIEQ